MTDTIAIVGSPTALGGHFAGMERGPEELRRAGLLDRLRSRPGLAGTTFVDHGDAPNDPGWAPDSDPVMKNRQLIIEYLPRLAAHLQAALGNGDSRLLVLGGDCTTHSGTMAALKRQRPGARLAIAWFDAHGDFNVPETTPSGNVWGMPFAMLCGRGDAGLVAACDGPTVREEDAALIGAQVLDEQESRMLAASAVAQFGSGMLRGSAGLAALEAWARVVGERCDGLYVAFDLDAIDALEGVAVAMPEPDGLSVETSIAALRILAATNRVVGFGPTATMRRADSPLDFDHHVDIVARLTDAALGAPARCTEGRSPRAPTPASTPRSTRGATPSRSTIASSPGPTTRSSHARLGRPEMDDTTTFYAFAGTVARMVERPATRDAPAELDIDVWNRTTREWRSVPSLYGKMTGLGGDPPLDKLSRDDARRSINDEPAAYLDGPGSERDYAKLRT